ncbi:MAG: manganese efflux pump MntP family protein [Deferribacterales bacterium]|jgi:putative Mn2+ efflux pump MntP
MLTFIDILGIAVAMSIDAFCVSVCIGMKYHETKHYLRLGTSFGFFQFAMPVIGAFAGRVMLEYTHNLKYLAAAILFFVAFNMLKEGICHKECKVYTSDPTIGMSLIMLSLATSMDALGAGISLALWDGGIVYASAVIGVVCLLFAMGGVHMGRTSKKYIGHYAEYAGSLVLALIGLKFIF